jgi:hypothetical protein
LAPPGFAGPDGARAAVVGEGDGDVVVADADGDAAGVASAGGLACEPPPAGGLTAAGGFTCAAPVEVMVPTPWLQPPPA